MTTGGTPQQLPETPTVASIAVAGLRSLGVDTLFCLPGVQNDDFFDALVDARDIRPLVTRHEQGAAYMALGAAQVTARPAALCVVPGPGMLNAAAGLTSAYWGNARVLALVGAVPSGLRGRGTGILHDLPDPAAVLRQLTKHTGYVGRGVDAVGVWQQAIDALTSGVPRPVAVEVPVDVWRQPADGVLEAPRATTPVIDTDQIEQAARVLGQARRPLIMVGGGAQDASEPVRRLAEMLEAPVFARHMGLGVMDTRHRLHAYLTVGRELWPTSDVVLGIGTRMEFPNVEWGVDPGQTIVQVNIDADELDRHSTGTVGVHGDAAETCRLLIEALGRHNRRRDDRTDEIAELRSQHFERIAYLEPQLSYLRAIRSVMPDDG
ncbi:MAG: TPP-binding protein, partial [Acidimicrobiaceae bacterium]|nr:TPP-binding protein [Acidimicrobiaceae bacterium]